LLRGNLNSTQKRNNRMIAQKKRIQNLMMREIIARAQLLRSLSMLLLKSLQTLLLKSKAIHLLKPNPLSSPVQSLHLTILFHSNSQTVTGARELKARSLISSAMETFQMKPLKAFYNKQSKMVRRQIQ